MRLEEIATPLRFVVTVDTEGDDAWSSPDDVRLENLRELPRFQDLCDEHAVVPTYLLAYECATRDEALSVLKPIADRGRCEIGHHLHVWTTPPFHREGPKGVDGEWIQAFQFQLPDSLFVEKAESLRQAIEKSFGRSPTAHRAGRWGIDQRTVDWLVGAGFVAETSMRTGIRLTGHDARGRSVPADRALAAAEYEPRRNPYLWASSGRGAPSASLVELPATVDVPAGVAASLLRRCLAWKGPLEAELARAYRRLGGLRMLRPDPSYAPGELPRIMERAIRQGVTVVNLMLHSSELALHCSPFSKTRQGLESIWTHLGEAFRYARRCGIESAGLSTIARLALERR